MTSNFISVSTDHTGTKIFQICLDDIIFMNKDAAFKGVYLHTLEKAPGYLPGSLDYWNSFLNASGLRMEQFDRSTSLNLSKVELLDKKKNVAYFEPVLRKDKSCSIAFSNFNDVVEALKGINRSFIMI